MMLEETEDVPPTTVNIYYRSEKAKIFPFPR